MKKLFNLFRHWYNVKEAYSVVDFDKVNTFEDLKNIYKANVSEFKVRKGSDTHRALSEYFKNE